ncbi:MAG TPA: isoprenylcysteine carboxylmethyltransferase family protein [Bryobacteraceae bacterium]|nr:isoprenylcysteine carboxylmethyltransferase family protein [Bryobacteraceae bacterium]
MTSNTAPPHTPPMPVWRQVLNSTAMTALWVGLMLLGAGRLDWTRGWIAIGLALAVFGAIAVAVRRFNPGLMTARARWRRSDTKSFDKWIVPPMMALGFVQYAVAGREAGCAGCESLAFAWLYPGAALYVAGGLIVGWAMAVNRHAETTVRIQTDRGHTVVTRGPYRFVRHPMYSGAILLYLGIPLVVGALGWTAVISAVIIALMILRTALEDRTLRRELAGYEHYTTLTPYRLVPGLW